MNHDAEMEQLIEERYRSLPWHGGIPLEEAISDMIAYRRELKPEERALFDEEVRSGRHPYIVGEGIELMAGRLIPPSAQPRRRKVAKAS